MAMICMTMIMCLSLVNVVLQEFGIIPLLAVLKVIFLITIPSYTVKVNLMSCKPIFSNVADLRSSILSSWIITKDQYFGVPLYRSRNAQNALKYRLTKELGNAGTWGKLALGLANVFF